MRDQYEKRMRGYTHPDSLVRPDGSETLVGEDRKKRKQELAARSGGRCEWIKSAGERCRTGAEDAHHKKPRSKGRDDRLENLAHLCRFHHNLVDWKHLRWTKK
jgi:hypothetical protein